MIKNRLSKILISVTIISFSISALIIGTRLAKTIDISNISVLSNQKIRILIVPGHEPDAGGADEFKKIKERDLNLQLSNILKDYLVKNKNIDVVMARDENGWNSSLENYVKTNQINIMNWVADMKEKMFTKVDEGQIEIINQGMKHNSATSSAVLFLYGTNKWIPENNIDLVIHIHFNNNPKINGKPNYSGYAMYVPEKQYSNSSSSKIFANYLNSIF